MNGSNIEKGIYKVRIKIIDLKFFLFNQIWYSIIIQNINIQTIKNENLSIYIVITHTLIFFLIKKELVIENHQE